MSKIISWLRNCVDIFGKCINILENIIFLENDCFKFGVIFTELNMKSINVNLLITEHNKVEYGHSEFHILNSSYY